MSGRAGKIVLEMPPRRLRDIPTNVRLWLWWRLTPQGRNLKRVYEGFPPSRRNPMGCDCLCHVLDDGLGYSHATECCVHAGRRWKEMIR